MKKLLLYLIIVKVAMVVFGVLGCLGKEWAFVIFLAIAFLTVLVDVICLALSDSMTDENGRDKQ